MTPKRLMTAKLINDRGSVVDVHLNSIMEVGLLTVVGQGQLSI
jgi:hypothetical protein